MTIQDKQREIYFHYGLHAQLEKLEEECLELALAIKHRKRLKDKYVENIIEEMADVLNIIEQFRDNNLYFKHGIKRYKEYKVDRQLSRINKND